MTQTPCPYDDRIRPRPYNPIVPEADNSRYAGATHPHLLPPTSSLFDVAHKYSHFEPSSVPYHGELNLPPRLVHPSYSFLPAGSEFLDVTPTDCGNLGPPQIYSPWGSYRPSSNLLPNDIYSVSPPTLHHFTSDQILYPNFPCRQSPWSTGNNQVSPVDEFLTAPNNHSPLAFPLHYATPSPDPQLDHASEPHSGTLDASYPCLWSEGGIFCNVMVQATRSHMNRHLHAVHGFGGSETRQTRCYWAGCGETMQQGSIARHMVTCHLQAKVTCPMCSKKLSRQDVISKHQRVCPAASAWR